MKTAIILIAALAVGFGAGWYSRPLPVAEQEMPQGGMEVPVMEVPEYTSSYLFPISEEDYLMRTSAFGVRVSPFLQILSHHHGLDIAGAWRSQVVAIADGVVTDHYPPPGTRGPRGIIYRGHDVYGGMVRIRHDDGSESLYGHLSRTFVRIGERVRAGDVIGRQGSTGRATGEHLHLELRVGGELVNPILYLPDVRGRNER